jgi:predicted nucleic acid-binding protein
VIVLDASALADWLLVTPGLGGAVAAEIAHDVDVHTLDFAWVEVASVVRRKHLAGEITAHRGEEVLADLDLVPLVRHPAAPLVGRVWSLRDTLTAYDAAYVALAEALRCTLVTTDGGVARAHGHSATVRLVQ